MTKRKDTKNVNSEAQSSASEPTIVLDQIRESVLASLKDTDVQAHLVSLIVDKVVKVVLSEIKKTFNFDADLIETTNDKLNDSRKEIVKLKEDLKYRTDELEQYQRRNSIRVFGVEEKAGEDTDALVLNIFNKRMGLSEVTKADLDRTHRVGPKLEGQHRAILVKFVSYQKRRLVFVNKKKLKRKPGEKTGFIIREDLTALRNSVLKEAISKLGKREVWTEDGRVIYRDKDGNRKVATRTSHLAKLEQRI